MDENKEFNLQEFLEKTTNIIPIDHDEGYNRIYREDDVDFLINVDGEIFKLIFKQQMPNYEIFYRVTKRF